MRISDWRSDVCSSDLMGIDAHARTTGRLEALHRARRRHEGVGIFGVDAALDRVAADHDVFLPDRQLLAAGDQQLLAHQVDAGDPLGHRVLDLDAGVHLDEVEAAVLEQELERAGAAVADADRSEEHTSELQSLMRISYAVFCLKKTKHKNQDQRT